MNKTMAPGYKDLKQAAREMKRPGMAAKRIVKKYVSSSVEGRSKVGELFMQQRGLGRPLLRFDPKTWAELEDIKVKDLYLERVHEGKVLRLRVVDQPLKHAAVNLLCADTDGNICRVAIYNIPGVAEHGPCDHAQLDRLFPKDSDWVVRDPWFKLGTADKMPALRVDNFSHLKQLSKYEDLAKPSSLPSFGLSSDMLKEEATKLFKHGDLSEALKVYNNALEVALADGQPNDWKAKVWCNCSLIQRKMEDEHNAVQAAEIALQLDQSWWRGHLRYAESLRMSGRLAEACSAFHTAQRLHPELLNDREAFSFAEQIGWISSRALADALQLKHIDIVRTVHPRGWGNFRSICNAIESIHFAWEERTSCERLHQRPQGSVIIFPGQYDEAIVIVDADIDLLAPSKGVSIKNSTGEKGGCHTVTLLGCVSTLHGLSISHGATLKLIAEHKFLIHALYVYGESVVQLLECHISNQHGLAVGVGCPDGEVKEQIVLRLQQVVISESQGGLVVCNTSRITCDCLTVKDIQLCGIELRDKAVANLSDCTLRRVGKHGIQLVAGSPTLHMENCEVSQTGSLRAETDTSAALFSSAHGCQITLRCCAFLDNHGHAIECGGAKLLVVDTTVLRSCLGNAVGASVAFISGTTARFERCELHPPINGEELLSHSLVIPGGPTVQILRNGDSPVSFDQCTIHGEVTHGHSDRCPEFSNPNGPCPKVGRERQEVLIEALDKMGCKEQFVSAMNKHQKDSLNRGGYLGNAKVCDHCSYTQYQKPESNFRYCSGCKSACYCSSSCQKLGRKRHKLVCAPVQSLFQGAAELASEGQNLVGSGQ